MRLSHLVSAIAGATLSGIALYTAFLFMHEDDFENFVDKLRLERSTIFNLDSYTHTLEEAESTE